MEKDLESGDGIQMIIGGDAITGVRPTQQQPTGQINYENISFFDNEFSSNPLHSQMRGGDEERRGGIGGGENGEGDSPRSNENSPNILENQHTFDAVTDFIVPISQNEFFQKWLIESYDEAASFKGFVSRHVHEIAQRDGYQEFVTVLIFRSYQTFKDWYTSTERSNLFKKLKKHHIQWSMMNAYGGNIEAKDLLDHQNHPKTSRITLQNSLVKIPKPMPPPKWKLTIVLIVSIYVLVVSYVSSGQSEVLFQAGLPRSFIYFIFVAQLVIVNVYALAPLVMEIPFVDAWLRMRRSDPESMHPIHAVLDQGLKMFAVKISPPPHPDLLRRLDTLERKIEKLREVEHNLKLSIQSSNSPELQPLIANAQEFHISSIRNIESSVEHIKRTEYRRRSNSDIMIPSNTPNKHKISMAVRHYVKWECVLEFEDWTNKMEAEMSK
jgi:antibiotic biosynthesis monooxygenase (ABM) superfamily enzyme